MTTINAPTIAMEDTEPFTRPGTSGLSNQWSAPRKFVSVFVMAGVAAVGTLGIAAPADVAAAQEPVVELHTLPAGAAALPSAVQPTVVPDVLQRLRRISGLSWGELATALDVSRRTIHNWLTGSRIADVHLTRLTYLEALVNEAAVGETDATRTRLLSPQASGRSLLDDFALASGKRSRPISTVSVGDLLGPAEGPVVGTSVQTERPSSLRGAALPRRPRGEA